MTAKKKKGTNFFDKIFLWLSIIVGIALLISYLAPVTDPRKFWPVAFFGLAYPLLLLANSLLLVYWLLRWNKHVIIPMLCMIIGWGTLCNNIGFRTSTASGIVANPKTLQVMTYNCHNFKPFGGENDPTTRHAILQMIAAEAPDVIGIQEFFTRRKGQYAIKDSMIKLMGTDHYYFEAFNLNTSQDLTGLAIFSKYPIVNKGSIIISADNGNQCIYVDVKKNGQTFRYYCIHLQSIRFEREDYTYLSKVSEDGKPDVTSSRRIGGKLKRAFMKRAEQVFKIKQHAQACPYPYIIAGDFNDTPSSFAVNQMAKGLKNAFREKGSGFARTYNGSFPNYQIDFVLASPGIDVGSYNIVQKKLSDHYPVTSTLLFK